MEYVEAEGSSIDEAIERAIKQLGVARDKVDIEILANATKGLFGLGGKKAKVRATLRTPLSLTDPIPDPPAKPRKKTRADNSSGDTAGTGSKPNEGKSKPPRERKPRAERSRGTRQPRREPRPEPREDRPEVEISAETLETSRQVLEQSVRLIGTEASVTVQRDDLGISLQIEGDESGILIGRRGQTLDALEYMINRVASRDTGHTTHLVVDSHGYRQRRRESLESLAQRMGERAEQRGKTVTMNPMSPRDRRIVHLALEENKAVETRSSGKGYFRKLLIIPERR